MINVKTFGAAAVGAAAIGLSVGSVAPAEAASFDFSYRLQSGDVLSGILNGNLQPDNDTVFVSEIIQPKFNGVLGPNLPFVQAFTERAGGSSAPPTVSFSGLIMDIIACDTPDCFDGFLFDGSGAVFGSPLYTSGPSYGSNFEAYDPDQWSLTPTPIPTPALLPGLLGMGIAAWRKRKGEQVEQGAERAKV